MSTSADRVQAYLDQRKTYDGAGDIITGANGVNLTIADLEAVLIHAPKTARCPKCNAVNGTSLSGQHSDHLVGGRNPGWVCQR